ncbi:Hypothetical predicted protein [Podarcis lilfordi]|uniref:Uncharacterized protein n=1 Tax=Podarcis lilfordi TaxID=74358 RepID=A0AA35PDM6_9SAUR|nr:Hypothetical predicted protein [Podarcis lilfordi]
MRKKARSSLVEPPGAPGRRAAPPAPRASQSEARDRRRRFPRPAGSEVDFVLEVTDQHH